MDDNCPVCQGPFQNPSEPVPCCRKVFCQSCLRQAVSIRPQCPHCRSPINNHHAFLPLRSALRGNIRLHGIGTSLRTSRTVGSNIQALLEQLRAADAQTSQPSNAIPPIPPASNYIPPILPALHYVPHILPASGDAAPIAVQSPIRQLRPVPAPRVPRTAPVAPAAPVTPVANPLIIPVNPSPQIDLHSDDPNDIDWQENIALMDGVLYSENIFRRYNCPYCQEGNLDDLDLRDHCNDNHHDDQRQVVCPVCVSLPHGNPTYCSRNFIAHLNLRHSYYIDDISNVYQNDDINLQDAILRSCQQR